LIGATNKDIGKLISDGQFREDLFMRFQARVSLPILSERIDDIPELINYFIRQVNSHVRFSPNCIEALKREEWPGNIRQLRSVIQLAGYLPKETPLEISDLTEIINQYKTIGQQDHDLLPPLPFSEDMSIDDILDNVRNQTQSYSFKLVLQSYFNFTRRKITFRAN
jgi:DNA-binding NtrC family response regulator